MWNIPRSDPISAIKQIIWGKSWGREGKGPDLYQNKHKNQMSHEDLV